MKHYGDITKLSGYKLPIVDVITGGSPCQDLSVAGKRAGLNGERSGLFMEQVRIVKEMRARDVQESGRTGQYVRPRYMVWENVPGAFSSNGGKDFQAVLSEIAKIAEPDAADVPMPEKGKWPNAGCIYDELGCWSIAWRVHDAQFWGVPQRRKRISLVADFGGLSAPEVLFERKGLSGNPEPGAEAGKAVAGATGSGAEGAISFQERAGKPGGGKGILIQHEHVGALSTLNNQSVYDARGNGGGEIVPTLTGDHQNRVTDYTALCVGGEIVPSLVASAYKGPGNTQDGMAVLVTDKAYSIQGNTIDRDAKQRGSGIAEDVCPPILSDSHGTPHAVAYGISSYDSNAMKSPNPRSGVYETDTARTLDLNGGSPACNQGGIAVVQSACVGIDMYNQATTGEVSKSLNSAATDSDHIPCVFDKEMYNCGKNCAGTPQARLDNVAPTCRADDHPSGVAAGNVVRRLTPLECERLQGYPDGWTDIGEWTDSKGKKHKDADSPRYKALGNSIALPFWQWMARRICAMYERNITMASLFDGIGGFPLVFQRCGATPVWASEIEEFPIAVTKKHFPEVDGC